MSRGVTAIVLLGLFAVLPGCKPNPAPGACGTAEPSEDPVCADSAKPAKASAAPSASPKVK